jgi:cytochrome c biogenesis protein CcdA
VTDGLVLSTGAALMLGLAFGAGTCSIVCLPLLGPALVGRGGGRAAAWLTVGAFSLGRLLGYTGIAAAAGLAGQAMAVESPWLMRLFTGLGCMLVGLVILVRAGRRSAGCGDKGSSTVRIMRPMADTGRQRRAVASGSFAMGLGMAFSPCAPLGTVVFAAAALGSVAGGAMLGMAFGAGATVIPALLFGLGVSSVAWRLRLHLAGQRVLLERLAGGFLVLLGCALLMGWVRL